MKYEGQEPANVRRCDIERLKKKLAKARHDRDEWRKRAVQAERLLSTGANDWLIRNLKLEIEELKRVVVRRVLDGAKERET